MDFINRILADVKIRNIFNNCVDLVCLNHKRVLDIGAERNKLISQTSNEIRDYLNSLNYDNKVNFFVYAQDSLNGEYHDWAESSDYDIERDAINLSQSLIERVYYSTMANDLIVLANSYNLYAENGQSEQAESIKGNIMAVMSDCNRLSSNNILHYINLLGLEAEQKMRQGQSFSEDAHVIQSAKSLKKIYGEIKQEDNEVSI